MKPDPALRDRFIAAAIWHGDLGEAESLLAEHPELRSADLTLAAIQGDAAAVRRFIAADPTNVASRSGPYQADALNYLGLSKYLRLDPARSDAFVDAARALLDAGADAKTGFWTTGTFAEFETALYGAAGVAHHRALTELLLERGADPNDEEATYHSPESYDLGALMALVETGRLTADSLALMLIRKHDWHDIEGVRYLLEHGADPNFVRGRGNTPMNHAVERDNGTAIFALLLEHGADPTLSEAGVGTPLVQSAHRGRGDLLRLFAERGYTVPVAGWNGLLAACALADRQRAAQLAAENAGLPARLAAEGGALLARFAGNNNAEGLSILLDLGVPVDAPYAGDGYFDIAPDSTALHVAAWRAWIEPLRLLISRGADVNARDGTGRSALQLAAKACVDSYWMNRRTPDGVAALLAAGASPEGVALPTGYQAVDNLFGRFRS